jgi:hypothetical protein
LEINKGRMKIRKQSIRIFKRDIYIEGGGGRKKKLLYKHVINITIGRNLVLGN